MPDTPRKTGDLSIGDVAALALRYIEDPAAVATVLGGLDSDDLLRAARDALVLLAGAVVKTRRDRERVAAILVSVPVELDDAVYAPMVLPHLLATWGSGLNLDDDLAAVVALDNGAASG